VYSGAFPVSGYALRGLAPVTITGLRFLIASAVMLPAASRVLRRMPRADILSIGCVAVIGLWGQMVLIYLGIDASQAAIAAVIVGLEPVMIALWAKFLLGEAFGARRSVGLAVGLSGSLLVAGVGSGGISNLGGLLLLLGTGLTFSWYTVSSKRYLTRYGVSELLSVVTVMGAAFGLVPMLISITAFNGIHGPTPLTWLCLLYLGIGNSVLGYALWNRGLSGLAAGAVGASLYAQPVLGALLSWAALREPLPATFLPGTVVVLLGVWIATSSVGTQITGRVRRSPAGDRPPR
jgi:drug/metabolite transporter (DMT)-like permease